jgi:hypothetical protein
LRRTSGKPATWITYEKEPAGRPRARAGAGFERGAAAPQVEFGFTGEGSDAAPAPASLRGLDAAVYYRAGALLNCGHAAVRGLVLGALRHWAAAYGVDGFCFLNAETLALGARAGGGPAPARPLFSACAVQPTSKACAMSRAAMPARGLRRQLAPAGAAPCPYPSAACRHDAG